MGKKEIEKIRKNMEAKSTEELQKILSDNDRERYYDETFEAVKQLLLEKEDKIPPEGEEIIFLNEQAQEKPAWGIGSKISLIYVICFIIVKLFSPTTADEGGRYIDDRRLLVVDLTKGEARVFNRRTGEFVYDHEELWKDGKKIVVNKDGFRYEYMPGSWNEIKYGFSDPFNAMGEISSFQISLLRRGWSPEAALDWDITRPSILGIIFVVGVIVVLVAVVRSVIRSSW